MFSMSLAKIQSQINSLPEISSKFNQNPSRITFDHVSDRQNPAPARQIIMES